MKASVACIHHKDLYSFAYTLNSLWNVLGTDRGCLSKDYFLYEVSTNDSQSSNLSAISKSCKRFYVFWQAQVKRNQCRLRSVEGHPSFSTNSKPTDNGKSIWLYRGPSLKKLRSPKLVCKYFENCTPLRKVEGTCMVESL